MKKIPVILDTDIGGDIDDTWALAMLLKSPELDLKLVVTDTGNTTYRAKVTAKLLAIAERTDVPVGIGLHLGDDTGPQAPWVEDYDLADYDGTVFEDGVGALSIPYGITGTRDVDLHRSGAQYRGSTGAGACHRETGAFCGNAWQHLPGLWWQCRDQRRE